MVFDIIGIPNCVPEYFRSQQSRMERQFEEERRLYEDCEDDMPTEEDKAAWHHEDAKLFFNRHRVSLKCVNKGRGVWRFYHVLVVGTQEHVCRQFKLHVALCQAFWYCEDHPGSDVYMLDWWGQPFTPPQWVNI